MDIAGRPAGATLSAAELKRCEAAGGVASEREGRGCMAVAAHAPAQLSPVRHRAPRHLARLAGVFDATKLHAGVGNHVSASAFAALSRVAPHSCARKRMAVRDAKCSFSARCAALRCRNIKYNFQIEVWVDNDLDCVQFEANDVLKEVSALLFINLFD